MPASPLPHALPVHPHQLEVQEFDSYALIVDLRSAEAYAIDHIPRAVSVPWPSQATPTMPTRTGADAGNAVAAAMEPVQGLPYSMEALLESLDPGSAVLLYCDQGGAVSAAVAPHLAARGITADVLPGGWASYVRWVGMGIEVLARALDWRWVRSLPGGVSQALVSALQAQGEQVLEVGAQVGQVLMPGLIADLSRFGAPSLQSRLVDVLRRHDPSVHVWVDEVISLSGEQVLPSALHEALRNSMQWRIDASIDCRADLLQALLRESGETVASLLDSLGPAMASTFAAALRRVRDLEGRTAEHELLTALLREVLDPLHESVAVPGGRGHERVVPLPSGTAVAVDQLVARLIAAQISP